MAGSEAAPWRTVEYALQRIRAGRPGAAGLGPEHHTTLHLRAGTHYLSSMISLSGRDSQLTIRGYRDEEPVVSGGLSLSSLSWQSGPGGVLTTSYTGSCGEAFLGDTRLLRARSPNPPSWGPNNHTAVGPYHRISGFLVQSETCDINATRFSQSGCPDENRNGFYLADEMSTDWADLDQTEILIFHSWIAEHARVASLQRTANGRLKVLFKEPLSHAPIGQWIKSGALRFLVVNNAAVMDMAGEFTCVTAGDKATLSYIPPEDAEPAAAPVVSQLTRLLQVSNANNINIEGIAFHHAAYEGLDDRYDYTTGAVVVQKSTDISVLNCEFAHTARMGLMVKDSSNILVEQNTFWDIGYNGFQLLGQRTAANVSILNNYFNGCGVSNGWGPACLWIQGQTNVRVANNEITNSAMTGIMSKADSNSVTYWTDQGITEPTNADYVHQIEYNYIHHFGSGVLSDFGAIKTGVRATGCDGGTVSYLENNCQCYTHVYNNLIHDGWTGLIGANFLYSDVSAGKNVFENNIVYGTGSGALYHHCGLENESKNNIIHRVAKVPGQEFGGGKPMYNIIGGCELNSGKHQSYHNHHNIYYFHDTTNLTFYRSYDEFGDNTVFSDNLLYSLDPTSQTSLMFPGGIPFGQLAAAGLDTTSVWADPGLQDPANHRYELAADSPAHAMGIKQIRLDNFGIEAGKAPFYMRN